MFTSISRNHSRNSWGVGRCRLRRVPKRATKVSSSISGLSSVAPSPAPPLRPKNIFVANWPSTLSTSESESELPPSLSSRSRSLMSDSVSDPLSSFCLLSLPLRPPLPSLVKKERISAIFSKGRTGRHAVPVVGRLASRFVTRAHFALNARCSHARRWRSLRSCGVSFGYKSASSSSSSNPARLLLLLRP